MDQEFDHEHVENHITKDCGTGEYVVWDETGADEAGRAQTVKDARRLLEEYAAFLDKGQIGPYLLRASELKAFDCRMVWDDEFDTAYRKPIVAFTRGRAKSEYYRGILDVCDDWKYTDIRCKCLGKPETDDDFKRIVERRGISFAHIGMVVEIGHTQHEGCEEYKCKRQYGWIIGANSSCNLNILCKKGDRLWMDYCHPRWDIRYFDADGNIIKEFGRD